MSKITAPFTDEQVEKLKEWQFNPKVHSFTCCSPGIAGCERSNGISEGDLIPRKEGWICPCGEYRQNWCYDFMVE